MQYGGWVKTVKDNFYSQEIDQYAILQLQCLLNQLSKINSISFFQDLLP